jgi:O-methyltransferase
MVTEPHWSLGFRLREWVRQKTGPRSRRLLTTGYRLARPAEFWEIGRFLRTQHGSESLGERLRLVAACVRTSLAVECAHKESEILAVIAGALASKADGCVIEAGAFKGGSTAKLSRAASLTGRKLYVFDSFQGIPPHEEEHRVTIMGTPTGFAEGDYAASVDEVREAVARYGDVSVCEFVEGWFDDTMPSFNEPIALGYFDVDLASSTRTCFRNLYPLLVEGGILYSQDGHLPLVVAVLADESFWRRSVGVQPPGITGLGVRKLVAVHAPVRADPQGELHRTLALPQPGGVDR